MNFLDRLRNSPHLCYKECIATAKKNLQFDVGKKRVQLSGAIKTETLKGWQSTKNKSIFGCKDRECRENQGYPTKIFGLIPVGQKNIV